MERLRSHFNTIKLTDIGSADPGMSKAQENIVVEDDNCNDTDVASDKIRQDECDKANDASSPAEKACEETQPPNSNTSSPKGK